MTRTDLPSNIVASHEHPRLEPSGEPIVTTQPRRAAGARTN